MFVKKFIRTKWLYKGKNLRQVYKISIPSPKIQCLNFLNLKK